jgi:hypothetical protein
MKANPGWTGGKITGRPAVDWGGSVRLKRPMRLLCGSVRFKRPKGPILIARERLFGCAHQACH